MRTLAILIVGGYGAFGGRLVELLDQNERLTLIVAGRSYDKARDFCYRRLRAKAKLRYARFERGGEVGEALNDLKPNLVVDCSGPFQAYGKDPYALIEACIARGVDYLDLADSSDFVAGVSKLDDAAKAKNMFVLSGASTAPALTAAAVRALAEAMSEIDTIRAGIGPSPYAIVGESVIRAIASYAGKPINLRRGGAETVGYALTEQCRFTIAPPGKLPLDQRLFSLVDVPDLRVLPELWPDVREMWMGAAPVPEILHRLLIACAWAVRVEALPSLGFLTPLMLWAMNHLRWGDHRGGMFVAIEGRTLKGEPRARSWHLLAEGDDGPRIPSMAAAAVVQKLLRGERPQAGARAAARDFELADYDAILAGRTIVTGFRDDELARNAPLYQRILGAAWADLPASLRALHASRRASGRARVKRGAWLAGIVASIMGFPQSGDDVPLIVTFDVADGGETWTRSFDGKSFSSHQREGRGRAEHLVCERFGPIDFAMALVVEDGKLKMIVRRWSVLEIPLPLWLAPWTHAYETERDGRFHFHVDIGHALLGRIVRYEGWLEPDYSMSSTAFSPAPDKRAASEADMN